MATIDLDYTLYHPLDQKYQSLYPPRPKDEAGGKEGAEDRGGIGPSKRIRASKPKLWDVVAQCRESGQLEALRDGRLRNGTTAKVDEEQGGSRSSYAKEKKIKAVREVEGDEEGGSAEGFFEE